MNHQNLLDHEGKKLPKSYYKTLAKLALNGKIPADDCEIEATPFPNPYSGKIVKLVGFAVPLARWILSTNPYKHVSNSQILGRHDWDNARYIFNVCWPDEYYDLID